MWVNLCWCLVLVGCVTVTGSTGTFKFKGTTVPSSVPGNLSSEVVVHRRRVTWSSAFQTCVKSNLSLLCYSNSERVSQLAAELAFLGADRMWLKNKNCSLRAFEPQLSANLKDLEFSRTKVKYVSQHRLEIVDNNVLLPFICHTPRSEVLSSNEPSALFHPEVPGSDNQRISTPFFILKGPFLWSQIEKACERQGGRIARSPTEEEIKVEPLFKVILELIEEPENSTKLWYRDRYEYVEIQVTENRQFAKIILQFESVMQTKYPVLCEGDKEITLMSSSFDKTTFEPAKTTSSVDWTSSTIPPLICCPARVVRDIAWDRNCSVAVQPCPKGAQGTASWTCNNRTGEWASKTPDLSGCNSPDFQDFFQNVNISDVPVALQTISKTVPLFGGDLMQVLNALGKVTDQVATFLEGQKAEVKSQVALNVTHQVLNIADDLLASSELWEDLAQDNRVSLATTFMEDQKMAAFQLAYSLQVGQHQTISRKTVEMQAVRARKGSYLNNPLSLPLPSLNGDPSGSDGSRVVLPAGFENSLPVSPDDTFVIFFLYKDMSNILVVGDHSNLVNVSAVTTANSPVVSVNLGGVQGRSLSLQDDLTYFLPWLDKNADRPVCVFWNTFSNVLGWDDTGCRLISQNDSWTECRCNHLTSFAVLMDVHGALDNLSELDQMVLSTVTIVGCVLSIVFLSAAVVITTVYRALWGMRNSVHRNLCLCLLVGEILFVAGIDRTEIKILCSVVAGLLHYFFLAAFCWMFLEAVVIYILLYKVFSPKKSYSRRFYAFGYGFPMLVVAITAGIQPGGYGTSDFCWLARENGVIWGFVGPAALVLLVALVALVYALHIAVRTNKKVHSKTAPPVTRTWILGALTLVPLLGITWTLGFLMTESSVVIIYAFTCLNTLQGVSIFVVQCLLNQSSRKCLMQSFAKFSPTVSLGSWSSTRRSTAHTDSRTPQSTSCPSSNSRSSTETSTPRPRMNPPVRNKQLQQKTQEQHQQSPWRRLLRGISSQSGSFDFSAEKSVTDSSEVCFSWSEVDADGVVLKNARKEQSAL